MTVAVTERRLATFNASLMPGVEARASVLG